MLRQGKLVGEKKGGKWAIPPGELENKQFAKKSPDNQKLENISPVASASGSDQRYYTIEQFAERTYLTEKGVRQWLQSGRLSGKTSANGSPKVDAANLSRPELKHIVR